MWGGFTSEHPEEEETEGDFWDMLCTKIRGIRMARSSHEIITSTLRPDTSAPDGEAFFGACPLTKSAHVDHFGSSLLGLLQVFSISYISFFLQLTSITMDSLDVAYCITTHGPTSRVA